jgi:N6-L-threonylcarbamoyladenine synthase
MKILAIETSCDDTGVAVVEVTGKIKPVFKILSNVVSSQIEVHKKWGGVYPALAKREHQKNLVPVLEKALKNGGIIKNSPSQVFKKNPKEQKTLNSILEREPELLKQFSVFYKKYDKPDVDAIAVTIGPGLEPCLWVGVNFAKALSYYWNLPIIPVNHIEGHILANFIDKFQKVFPAVCLVVSGGHTQLILMKDFGKYEILGETRDDAAGECFDKTAQILGLEYPGGPIIAVNAAKNHELKTINHKLKLPRPMISSKDYDFSFSGLKTAVLYLHKKQPNKIKKTAEYIKQMCSEIQQAVIDILIKKTIKAVKDYKAKTIIIGGGVAANKELRSQMGNRIRKESSNIRYLMPNIGYCTDNAVMVALAGYFRWKKLSTRSAHSGQTWQGIKAEANLRIE